MGKPTKRHIITACIIALLAAAISYATLYVKYVPVLETEIPSVQGIAEGIAIKATFISSATKELTGLCQAALIFHGEYSGWPFAYISGGDCVDAYIYVVPAILNFVFYAVLLGGLYLLNQWLRARSAATKK